MGAGKLRKSLDQEQATPRASFRRAGHTWGDAVGPFAREKGYKAATLRTAPQVKPLAGNGQLRRKDCRPCRFDALLQAHSCSFTFFSALGS